MELISRIANNTMELVRDLTNAPLSSALLAFLFGVAALVAVRNILGSLNEMHRSKSALKKINKNYSLWKKLVLLNVWEHCLHAQRFSRILICLYHVRSVFLPVSFLLAVISYANPVFSVANGHFTVSVMVLFDLPVFVLHLVLDKHPFRRFKMGYRFEKYNHTEERNKLL